MSGRLLKLTAGLAVSAAALYLLLAGTDGARLSDAWSSLSGSGIVLAGILLVCGYAVRIVRWWWMLRAFQPKVRLADCATPFLASFALNNVLPLRAGDAVRAFGFQRRLGVPSATLLGTVVIERLLDLSMLLVFFFAGLSVAPADILPSGMTASAKWLAVAAVVMLVALPFTGPAMARRIAPPQAAGSGSKIHAARAAAAAMLESFALLRSGWRALVLLPLTALIWTLEGAVFATVAADIASGAPAVAGWFAMTAGTLATLLPSTPGYVGTFDYFTMLGLSAFGVGRDAATAFALSVHALLWLPVTFVGLSLLALHGGRAALLQAAPTSDTAARRPTPT